MTGPTPGKCRKVRLSMLATPSQVIEILGDLFYDLPPSYRKAAEPIERSSYLLAARESIIAGVLPDKG